MNYPNEIYINYIDEVLDNFDAGHCLACDTITVKLKELKGY